MVQLKEKLHEVSMDASPSIILCNCEFYVRQTTTGKIMKFEQILMQCMNSAEGTISKIYSQLVEIRASPPPPGGGSMVEQQEYITKMKRNTYKLLTWFQCSNSTTNYKQLEALMREIITWHFLC